VAQSEDVEEMGGGLRRVTPSEPNEKLDLRVVVLMRHRMVREGIALLLEHDPSISDVLVADDATELLEQCRRATPDVVVVDLGDSGMNASALQQLRESCPNARFVGVAGSDDLELAGRAVTLGIDGVYVKSAKSDQLTQVILDVATGRASSVSDLPGPRRAERAGAEPSSAQLAGTLTPRELEVLDEFAQGTSTAHVADRLGISPLTVQSHVKSILVKLGVHSKIEAVTMAFRLGLVTSPVRDGGAQARRSSRLG
jgi:DNA-binding NarL/FixJ family response regulator